jgi:hypothetical protein
VLPAEDVAVVARGVADAPLRRALRDPRPAFGAHRAIDIGRFAIDKLGQLPSIPQTDAVEPSALDSRLGKEAVRDNDPVVTGVPLHSIEQLTHGFDANPGRPPLSLHGGANAILRQDQVSTLVEATDVLDVVAKEFEQLREGGLEGSTIEAVDFGESRVGREHRDWTFGSKAEGL